MTEKEFRQSFKRGLGCAIIEIQQSDDKLKFRDIVKFYCLRDISFDWQCEGTKGDYLYTAICELGEEDFFENNIIKRFSSRCNDRLFSQLSRILYLYANYGSKKSKTSLMEKYEYFNSKKGHLIKNGKIDEEFQRTDVYFCLSDLQGINVFKHFAETVGSELLKNPDNENVIGDWDWIMHCAERDFGEKPVKDYLDKAYENSNEIKELVDYLETIKASRKEHEERREKEIITVESVFKAARGAVLDSYPHAKIIRYRRWLHNTASEADISELIDIILHENDKVVKGLLIHMFATPKMAMCLEIQPLLEHARSDNDLLSEAAINCLKNLRDKRIHDLAIDLLRRKGIESCALGLLAKNYRKSDDFLINKLVMRLRSIPHHIQQDVERIYRHNRSADSLPVLLHVYKKGDCSFCREFIIRAMNHCGVLSNELLEECLFDSYDDTRNYAKRVISARKRKNI